MEEFSLDNILDDSNQDFSDIVGHLSDNDERITDDESDEQDNSITEDSDEDEESVEEPKSVGNLEEEEDEEDAFEDDEQASPNNAFYSSMALALSEEGILPDLDEETINNIRTPQDLRDAIEELINKEIGEANARIKQALDDGVPASVIRKYEDILQKLSNIPVEFLEQETEEAENVRKALIYNDFINRGFSEERAKREMEKSINGGNDIEDAKEALQGNLDFYKTLYNNELQSANAKRKEYDEKTDAAVKKIEKNIMNENTKFFGDIVPDKKTRQKIYNNISRPAYKDPKTGNLYTEIQKYELEHPEEFIVNLGVLYTLTDGFTNLDKLVKGRVKKEVKKGFRELESKINNTSRDAYGNLKFASGEDDESYFGKGLKFDF